MLVHVHDIPRENLFTFPTVLAMMSGQVEFTENAVGGRLAMGGMSGNYLGWPDSPDKTERDGKGR
jgi:hypothetical protein